MICGTAASRRSAQLRRYYAGPGNRFWRVLAETGLTPTELSPREYRRLLDFGIGLTDVVKDQAGMDKDVAFGLERAEALLQRIRSVAPTLLCFNGKRAAQVALERRRIHYGLQPDVIDRTQVFVAPSTSAAARRWWDSRHWHDLAARVRATA